MNPTTDLTALVAAITASADTDHVVHVASGTFPHRGQRLIFGCVAGLSLLMNFCNKQRNTGNYTQEFTCSGCANKTISFVGRLPAAAVSGKISFNISQANNISFSGQSLPLACCARAYVRVACVVCVFGCCAD
jgi:hypothetical protein